MGGGGGCIGGGEYTGGGGCIGGGASDVGNEGGVGGCICGVFGIGIEGGIGGCVGRGTSGIDGGGDALLPNADPHCSQKPASSAT